MLWEKYVEQHYFGAFSLVPLFILFFNFVALIERRLGPLLWENTFPQLLYINSFYESWKISYRVGNYAGG